MPKKNRIGRAFQRKNDGGHRITRYRSPAKWEAPGIARKARKGEGSKKPPRGTKEGRIRYETPAPNALCASTPRENPQPLSATQKEEEPGRKGNPEGEKYTALETNSAEAVTRKEVLSQQ